MKYVESRLYISTTKWHWLGFNCKSKFNFKTSISCVTRKYYHHIKNSMANFINRKISVESFVIAYYSPICQNQIISLFLQSRWLCFPDKTFTLLIVWTYLSLIKQNSITSSGNYMTTFLSILNYALPVCQIAQCINLYNFYYRNNKLFFCFLQLICTLTEIDTYCFIAIMQWKTIQIYKWLESLIRRRILFYGSFESTLHRLLTINATEAH